ncbi:MAG: VOC family protein [Chloroflexota bacterium]
MEVAYKPEGYSTVSPYLVVSGAARTIEFLIETFDGVELRRFDREDGSILHAEVQIEDSVVMLADPPEGTEPAATSVHVYVRDVMTTYAKGLKAGGLPIQTPVQKDDPDKRGAIRDSGGTTWWIATQVGTE